MIKCPHCEAAITSVNIEAIKGIASPRKQWHCIAHTCPQCLCVLSVQIDPVALKKDTLDGVETLLKKWK